MNNSTIQKIKKGRKVLDWVGIAASFVAIPFVHDNTTRLILFAVGVVALAITLLRVDEWVERSITKRFVRARSSK